MSTVTAEDFNPPGNSCQESSLSGQEQGPIAPRTGPQEHPATSTERFAVAGGMRRTPLWQRRSGELLPAFPRRRAAFPFAREVAKWEQLAVPSLQRATLRLQFAVPLLILRFPD